MKIKYPIVIVLCLMIPWLCYQLSIIYNDFTYIGVGALLSIFIAFLCYD